MISFYTNGWLNCNGPLSIDWETFVGEFVFNQHRSIILEEYKTWLEEVKKLEITQFYQWINGSFISRRPAPRDLDMVTFLPAQTYEANEINLQQLSRKFQMIDCYWVKEYPPSHPKHFVTQFDKVEWTHLFSTDRMKNQKGFIQLNF